MKTIHRDIVGGFIFSSDGKLLLGKNRSGGVYEGSFVVPGGGVDGDESELEALKREMIEETGINIKSAHITKLNESSGEHEKTLENTRERVLVKMIFHDYKIKISKSASDIDVIAHSDWSEPQWFTSSELSVLHLSPPTRHTLLKIGVLAY